jgi:type I restriction enzyme S subunit
VQTKYTEYKIRNLVDLGIIEKPLDGNHGEIHPQGDDFISAGIPFIMSSDINNGVIDFKNCKFISKAQAKTLRKGFSTKGDVLLTHKASIGRTAIVPTINTDYILLTPQVTYYRIKDGNKLNNGYLKYFFDSKSFQAVLAAFSGAGSTRAYIGITEQLNLPIRLPDINTQKKVASVLSSLDSKIELNNRINAELEAMAKTLYDYWFVQFEFPDANGKPYKTSGGKMVWNEKLKREIPEGWEVEILNNIVSDILDHRGKTPLKLGGNWANKGDGVIALSAKHVKDGKLIKLEDANIVDFEMYKKWMPEKLKEGDILMTSEAPLGEFYFILSDTNYCMSQRLFAIRADTSKVLSTYLYYELSKGHGYSQIIGKQSGSTVFGIRQDELRKINILKPKLNLQKKLDDKVMPMLANIRNNEFQNQKLTKLRDWLLPMLMNGQVKVN